MKSSESNYQTWVEIDLKALKHNFNEIKRVAGSTEILAVIKADAYGHGMVRIGKQLEKLGAKYIGVSDVREGIKLRQAGIKKPILLFESVLASDAKSISNNQLTPSICTLELANALNRHAQKAKKNHEVHIKIDTGMGRLGIWHTKAFDFIQKIRSLRNLKIVGIFTHFPVADTDRKFTQKQIQYLKVLVLQLKKSGLNVPYVHAANSMGLAKYNASFLNLARPGIMLYGLYPLEILKKKLHLKPVMGVKSKVIFLKDVVKGRSISYGRKFFAKKTLKIATIPIGYNDGYFRNLSHKSSVIIKGKRCFVVGTITMDQIMADVSNVPRIMVGTPVTILGQDKNISITADNLANDAGTINYEIVCSLGNRLPRVYI